MEPGCSVVQGLRCPSTSRSTEGTQLVSVRGIGFPLTPPPNLFLPSPPPRYPVLCVLPGPHLLRPPLPSVVPRLLLRWCRTLVCYHGSTRGDDPWWVPGSETDVVLPSSYKTLILFDTS